MSRHVLGMGLLAITVSAQANFASSGFQYVGCVEAKPELFGLNIDFFKPFTPQECQDACAGKATYAALGGGCKCDVPHQGTDVTYKVLDEEACTVLCIPGSPDAGRCGGSGEGDEPGTQLFSLYKKAGEDSAAGGAAMEEREGDCHEDDAAVLNQVASIVVETIYSCPPEKEDCPLRAAATKLAVPVCPPEGCQPSPVPEPAPAPALSVAACPPEGCQPQPEPAPTPAPAPLPTPVPEPCPPEGCAPVLNKVPVCPAEGCRSCPPEGCPPCGEGLCLPACPEGCVAPPAPEVLATPVAPTPSPAPVCPGGCNVPTTLTPAPLVTASSAIPAPPSPPEPESTEESSPPSDRPTVVSEARKGPAVTVEMLTVMGAAIVLLVF